MEENLTEIYDALAAGKGDTVDLEGKRRPLLYACVERANSEDPETRLGALRVAAHLTEDDRLRLVEALITDPEARVRQYAFNLAIEAQRAGLPSLKTAVTGPDEELATEALGMLITQAQRTDGLAARKWLDSDFPRVRAGAAMLLGNISGPSLAVPLRRMAESDPDPAVRVIAQEAARRTMGELERTPGQNFWEAGPALIPMQAPVVTPEPVAAPPAAAPPPAVPQQEIVPQATGQEELRDEARDWRMPSPLPTQLPNETRAVLKLLGMVAAADRPALCEKLTTGDINARNTLLRSWRSGSDAALGRGIAIAIGELDLKTHAVLLRSFLRDPEPAVRAGAAEGVGKVGAPSLIPPLDALLRDADVDVRLAAIAGLTHLLTRSNRQDMLRDKLGPLTDEDDERIKIAATEALEGLA